MRDSILEALHPVDTSGASLVDLVEIALEQAILDDRLPEGSPLAEADLAVALGVSRSPVRDALKRLAHKGLVEVRPRKGVSVATFSPAQISDFFDLREALEGLAARLAAERMSSEDIARLRIHLDHVEDELAAPAARRPRGYPAAEEDFHARILHGARSLQLAGVMTAIQPRVRLLRRRSGAVHQRAEQAPAEHRAILAAIEARDPAAAEAGMRQHIRNARESLLGKS
jgi:DNA-binding GntR family transcriptional regulator